MRDPFCWCNSSHFLGLSLELRFIIYSYSIDYHVLEAFFAVTKTQSETVPTLPPIGCDPLFLVNRQVFSEVAEYIYSQPLRIQGFPPNITRNPVGRQRVVPMSQSVLQKLHKVDINVPLHGAVTGLSNMELEDYTRTLHLMFDSMVISITAMKEFGEQWTEKCELQYLEVKLPLSHTVSVHHGLSITPNPLGLLSVTWTFSCSNQRQGLVTESVNCLWSL